MKKIIILMTILLISILSMGELYRTEVDSDYGFYQVRNVDNPAAKFSYINHTLNIYVGDTVEWVNYADPDEKLTIDGFEIVDDNTFGGIFYHTLRRNYQKYSYTFNRTGKYRIHIDEYPRITSQTIIVKNIYFANPELFFKNITVQTGDTAITIPNTTQPKIESKDEIVVKNTSGFEFILVVFVLAFLVRKL